MKKTSVGFILIAIVTVVLPAQLLQHEVRDGETLYGIARRYDLTVERLTESNALETPDLLLPGAVLTIPNRYRVERGDTLYAIAQRFQTTIDAISDKNSLTTTSIRVGQIVTLPDDAVITGPSPTRSNGESLAGVDGDTSSEARGSAIDGSKGEDRDSDESDQIGRQTSGEAIVVAAEISEPLSFADGGVWPVAGDRRILDGKLPGVMIRAERGSPVYSIASGRVVYAGPHTTFGNVVFIQSTQGYIYVYGGQEAVGVEVGDFVNAGVPIGTVGLSPSEGSAALYFSVWRHDEFVDPEVAPRG